MKLAIGVWAVVLIGAGPGESVRATRLLGNPIVTEAMLPGPDGGSINGPSMIRVPDWAGKRLGRYYLYFSHHSGKYIRMAYADRPEGPWKIHEGGVLNVADQSAVKGHIASPDAVVDEQARRVYLFYHGKGGATGGDEDEPGQSSSVAVSEDGLHFRPLGTVVGPAYLRVFRHAGAWYAVNGRGALLRAPALGQRFVAMGQMIGDEIPMALDPVRRGEPGARSDRPATGSDRYTLRHSAVDLVGDRLAFYFTCVGHRPERIFVSFVELKGAPEKWRATEATEVLRPEKDWEGAQLELQFSKGGRSRAWENGIRDPAIFREGARAWLLYSTAGEHGLGMAELRYGSGR
ncbi:MAG: hypothetical protein U0R19_20415 [Bryobacteraceae bacterium]